MTSLPTRRDFLARSSLALASGFLPCPALAGPHSRAVVIPTRAKRPVSVFAPPVLDPEVMRKLARTAIEAAVAAGARSADIRIGDQRTFSIGGEQGRLVYHCGYGIRVEVGGATAFVGGADPTTEGLVQAARSAVATAQGLARIAGSQGPFTPVPVVTGEWKASLEIDPFSVAPEDHLFVLMGLGKIETIQGQTIVGGVELQWQTETRVFASSAGSLVTQQLASARPSLTLVTFVDDPRDPRLFRQLSIIPPSTAGFEIMLGTAVQERINVKMRELDAWRQYSIGDPEIGRKELILDGWSTGAVLGTTLVPALSLARALGDEQDASGTSFLTPPERVLGEPLFSPHLNLSIVTGGTQFGRMQWDDDGVAPRAAPLIMRGTVVDYLCSRANVETLHEWYAKQGRSLQPQGVERAESPTAVPMTCAGAVAMDAVATGPTVDEMVKSVKDGVLVRGGWASADQQHSSGIVMPTLLFAIRNGRITHRLVGATVEFSTKKLWKELVAIGHPSTAETTLNGQYGGVPIAPTMHTVTAPAVHIHEANVFSPL